MNGSSGELAKAKINVLEGEFIGKSIECMFRPKEYTITKQNSWVAGETVALNVPPQKFSSGGPSIMTMELFFDTYESGKDVREYTNKIWKLMCIDPKITEEKDNPKGRPPKVEFEWGRVKSFKAVITNINQKFTMFLPNGTPVRTTLNVTFQEAEEPGKYPFQNPTTGSTPGYKVRIIKEGESLDWIAHEEYGNPALWRFIADTNNLENPMKLSPGQTLSIAPAP
jgi:hypothetical protein